MWTRLIGLGAVLGAFGAGSCCLAPVVFSLLGLSTVTSLTRLRYVAPYREWLFGFTVLALGGGCVLAWRRWQALSWRDWALLGGSTLAVMAFLGYTIALEGLPRLDRPLSDAMLATIQKLGLLGTVASTVASLGCCAGVLGPLGAVLLAGGLLDQVPPDWRLPFLYGSVAVGLGSVALGWRRHRRLAPLGLFVPGAAALLYALHEALDVAVFQVLVWAGLGLLAAATACEAWLTVRGRACAPIGVPRELADR